MKLRSNIIAQFTVITFLIILAVTIILAPIVTQRVTESLIQSHIQIFPDLARITMQPHREAVLPWFAQAPGERLPAKVEELFANLLEIKGVFRIKVWGPDGTILWSDHTELIGQNFADNSLFLQAVAGQVVYSKKSGTKQENFSERGTNVILEIYTPVFDRGRVAGVIEFYDSDELLHSELASARDAVWFWTASGGLLLYLLQFAVFLQAHLRYRKTTQQLIETQNVTIHALAYQSEIHDVETGNHLERTTHYVRILAEELSRGERDRAILTKEYREDLVKSAPLHDIGKVGVRDDILHKPGALEPDEFQQMQRHCEYGTLILRRAIEKLSFESFLKTAIDITQCHHEKWDGSGYPTGLHGEDIPIAARIMAVADVYDALRSKRYYKNPMPHEQCLEIITADRGKAFDPLVVDALLRRQEEFLGVSRRLTD